MVKKSSMKGRPLRFFAGDSVQIGKGKKDSRTWKICRDGHLTDAHGHFYYKCYRPGGQTRHARTDALALAG